MTSTKKPLKIAVEQIDTIDKDTYRSSYKVLSISKNNRISFDDFNNCRGASIIFDNSEEKSHQKQQSAESKKRGLRELINQTRVLPKEKATEENFSWQSDSVKKDIDANDLFENFDDIIQVKFSSGKQASSSGKTPQDLESISKDLNMELTIEHERKYWANSGIKPPKQSVEVMRVSSNRNNIANRSVDLHLPPEISKNSLVSHETSLKKKTFCFEVQKGQLPLKSNSDESSTEREGYGIQSETPVAAQAKTQKLIIDDDHNKFAWSEITNFENGRHRPKGVFIPNGRTSLNLIGTGQKSKIKKNEASPLQKTPQVGRNQKENYGSDARSSTCKKENLLKTIQEHSTMMDQESSRKKPTDLSSYATPSSPNDFIHDEHSFPEAPRHSANREKNLLFTSERKQNTKFQDSISKNREAKSQAECVHLISL